VGGIDRATWSFWRNQRYDVGSTLSASLSATNILTAYNALYATCRRGTDVPDLVVVDNTSWGFYVASQQTNQRFSNESDMAKAGFITLKYMNADVVLDGGIGGNCPSKHSYFLNSSYLHWRPHVDRNFVPIGDERMSTNQDAIVRLIGFAGNLTASGLQFQGLVFDD
jgi:hypothetical protein